MLSAFFSDYKFGVLESTRFLGSRRLRIKLAKVVGLQKQRVRTDQNIGMRNTKACLIQDISRHLFWISRGDAV
jgi:hypothetical protein